MPTSNITYGGCNVVLNIITKSQLNHVSDWNIPFSPPQVIFATLEIIKFMEQIIKIENTYYKISDETPEIGEEYISKWCFNSSYDFQYFLSKNYNNEKENLEFPENTFIFKIINKISIIEKFGIFQINKIISNNHESNSTMVESCYIPYKLDFETLEDALFYKQDLKHSENYIVKSYFI